MKEKTREKIYLFYYMFTMIQLFQMAIQQIYLSSEYFCLRSVDEKHSDSQSDIQNRQTPSSKLSKGF